MSIPEEVDPPQMEDFKVDEYKDMMKGSFDTGDPLTTNLYVGNINPKVQWNIMFTVVTKCNSHQYRISFKHSNYCS